MIEALLLCVIIYVIFYLYKSSPSKSDEKKSGIKLLSKEANTLWEGFGFKSENCRVTISMENVIYLEKHIHVIDYGFQVLFPSGPQSDPLQSIAPLFDFAQIFIIAGASSDADEEILRKEVLKMLPIGKEDWIPQHVRFGFQSLSFPLYVYRESYFIQLTSGSMP